MTAEQKDVMSRAQAAAYIGIGKSTLDRLNIPRIKIRKRVLYKRATLENWLAKQEKAGT